MAVLAASFVFRAPALLNAGQTNSDAAVVGLQAMHVLRGEWSPFLWGSGYQTSVDSVVVAAFFAVLGALPVALMLASLALHVALTWLAFDALRRRTSSWMAALLVLPLVFTSSPSHTYILYPPRQAALTLVVLAVWLFDRATEARAVAMPRRFAIAGLVAGLACFADPYALVAMPAVAVFGVTCAWPRDRADRGKSARLLASSALGGLLGLVPLFLLWGQARASHGQVGITAGVIARNARLFVDACMPWAIGAKVYFARHAMDYAPWDDAPWVLRAVQIAGSLAFVALFAMGAVLAFARRVPWEVRRMGIAGSVAIVVTVLGFLTSVMVMDIFSARYLAMIFLFIPFALAPVAQRFGMRRFAFAIAPYLLASAIAGWVGYGPFVRGVLPVRVDHGATDEDRLFLALGDRGVRVAMADYWTSYRLTFLSRETLVVVPTNASEDRYPPYRAEMERASTVAYVFDPYRSREEEGSFEKRVMAGESPFQTHYERLDVGALTALVLHRR